MNIDSAEFQKWMKEECERIINEMNALADSKKELHFVPRDPKDKKLKPFYGTMKASEAGDCYVSITRDEEAPWLRKGKEILLEFESYRDFVITPVE